MSLRYQILPQMKLARLALLCGASAVFLAACQTAPNPYSYNYMSRSGTELCLVRNPANSEASVLQLKAALKEKGFSVKEVRAAAFCDTCLRFKTQSSARLTLEKAELSLEEDGRVKHLVTWSSSGKTQLDMVDMQQAIGDLVDRMFPEPMPWKTN